MMRWLRAMYLRMLIRSADKDVERYVDDERHAQRQQALAAQHRANLRQRLLACADE